MRRIGNELGVRYIAEGTMRQAGNELRIAVQLVDASSRVYLWAETFNRELQKAAPVELRNEITDRIVATIADVYGVLARAIAATTGAKSPESLTPCEAVWRFYLAQQRGSAGARRITCRRALHSSAPPSSSPVTRRRLGCIVDRAH